MAGLKAFREAYMSGQALDEEDFGDFDNRKLRYAIYWALFENTAYRSKLHTWATSYRLQYALYKYIREIYSPSYRLCEFHKAHLMGGALDPEAGDGQIVPSALPIIVPDGNQGNEEALRLAISQVWEWSNWQQRKDVFTLYGAVLGDVGLKVVDDVQREKVYLEVVHPGIVKEVELDPFGNVKAYTFQEERDNPQREGRTCTYMEVAEREGQNVVYRTYLDGNLYPWNGKAAEWTEQYGFIPLVMVQHNNVGLEWGWSELHPGRSKFHEVDDLASALSDQIRKTVNVVWLFSGMAKQDTLTLNGADDTTERPEPGREEVPALYASNKDAKATPLVATLNLADTAQYILSLMERLEEDYPELRFEKLRLSQVTGETLREARKPVEEKVVQRRAGYDDALRRAQQMALTIGGHRGIWPFSLSSYEEGTLDHHIGKRPVFTDDPQAELESDKLFWAVAEQAGKAGVPLTAYLKLQGWTDEQIGEVTGTDEYQERQRLKGMAMQGFGMVGEEEEEEEEEESE